MIAGKTTLSDTGYNVPDWDSYFMAMVFIVATKSKDQSTRCGSILVDKDNRVLSIGYNGPFRGFPDEIANDFPRPEKYLYWIHSETNAIMNYTGAKSDLEGATIYITGKPCARCLSNIIQSGIKRIVYHKSKSLKMFKFEPGHEDAYELMVKSSGIEVLCKDFSDSIYNTLDTATKIFKSQSN